MAQSFVLPDLGENIDAVDVSAVLVSKGDSVKKDQPVLEVETEKASLEVPVPYDGVVVEVLVSDGSKIKIGEPILTLDSAGAAEDAPAEADEAAGEASQASEAPDSTKQPAKTNGASSAAQTPAEAGAKPPEQASAEEAQETASQPSQEDATPEQPDAPRDTQQTTASTPQSTAAPKKASPQTDEASVRDRPTARPLAIPIPASPSVRRLAREIGVDLEKVEGSGPSGRISAEDIKAHAKQLLQGGGSGLATATELPDLSAYGPVREEPLTNIRKATAANLARAWNTIPAVTQFDKADVTELEALRKKWSKRPSLEGQKLTVTAILLKVMASALQRFPNFNSALDLQKNVLVFREYIHLGVAVDTDRGLLVPVIKDVDQKNIVTIVQELADLAVRARERKLKPDEMQGASCTLSNLGGLGTTYFSPIVNWPEVAILGVGRSEMKPTWDGEGFRPRRILPLAVSYDHRVIDGADAARFLRWIAEALEEPLLIAFEG